MTRNRIDVFLGTVCNNNCIFCCSKETGFKELSTQEVKNIIDRAIDNNADEIHFTGSEPTIRKDIFELIDYSKKRGFESIKLTSNGRMLSYQNFLTRLKQAGLNGIIISIHGHNAKLHDSITKAKGCFDQMLSGIKKIENSSINLETNTTIIKQNLNHLTEIGKLISKFNIGSAEFNMVHPRGMANKYFNEVVPEFKDISGPVKKVIELGHKNNKIFLTRYIPFCFLKTIENSASELYEPTDLTQAGSDYYDPNARKSRYEKSMIKYKSCKYCKFDKICMGIHSEHKKNNPELSPIPGIKLTSREELIRG